MVSKTMSATEARVHFGEVLRDVSERDEVVVVERDGSPKAVIVSVARYEEMRGKQDDRSDLEKWFDETREARERIANALAGYDLPDVSDIIHEMREERDAQLLENLLGRQSRDSGGHGTTR